MHEALTSKHSAVPDRRFRADLDVSNDRCVRGHKCVACYFRNLVEEWHQAPRAVHYTKMSASMLCVRVSEIKRRTEGGAYTLQRSHSCPGGGIQHGPALDRTRGKIGRPNRESSSTLETVSGGAQAYAMQRRRAAALDSTSKRHFSRSLCVKRTKQSAFVLPAHTAIFIAEREKRCTELAERTRLWSQWCCRCLAS
jgi:hypothetical protein